MTTSIKSSETQRRENCFSFRFFKSYNMFWSFSQIFIKIDPPQAWMHTDKKLKSDLWQLLLSMSLRVMTLRIPPCSFTSCGNFKLLLSCSTYFLSLAKITAYTF